jgi:hypothetical protein
MRCREVEANGARHHASTTAGWQVGLLRAVSQQIVWSGSLCVVELEEALDLCMTASEPCRRRWHRRRSGGMQTKSSLFGRNAMHNAHCAISIATLGYNERYDEYRNREHRWHKRITCKHQNANDKTDHILERPSSGTELHDHHTAPRGFWTLIALSKCYSTKASSQHLVMVACLQPNTMTPFHPGLQLPKEAGTG